jgi:germination protein M
MTGRTLRFSPIVLALGLAACGGGQAETTQVRVYFLRDGKVGPVARQVSADHARAGAQAALLDGPTAQERAIGLASAPPRSRAALAQLVYTLTQFPGSPTALGHARADFEDLTPLILVESPLPFAAVRSPLRASGTANTFEATFQYELVGPGGDVVASHFVTATSGNGQRGTFAFTAPFSIGRDGPGRLVVFENDAASGERTHVVEIPLTLTR